MNHTRPINRRREQLRATHVTGPSTLSVQVLHGHDIASRGEGEDVSSLVADKAI